MRLQKALCENEVQQSFEAEWNEWRGWPAPPALDANEAQHIGDDHDRENSPKTALGTDWCLSAKHPFSAAGCRS